MFNLNDQFTYITQISEQAFADVYSCFSGERARKPRSDGHGAAENRCQVA